MKTTRSLLWLLAFTTWACQPDSNTAEADPPIQAHGHFEVPAEQLDRLGLQFGQAEQRSVSAGVHANGYLAAPPDHQARLTVPIPGNVARMEILEGMKVRRGQVLAYVSHPDYLALQRDYLSGKARLGFLEKEIVRQRSLAVDNFQAQRELERTESELAVLRAEFASLSESLKLLGISPAGLTSEALQGEVALRAPIDGYITHIWATRGQLIGPNQPLCLIQDIRHLHAELEVFEQDAASVQPGQRAHVRLGGKPDSPYYPGKVVLVGHGIDSTRTMRIHVEMDSLPVGWQPGLYLEADIQTDPSDAWTLPLSAIERADGRQFYYRLIKKNAQGCEFERVPVKLGRQANGFVEVTPLGGPLDLSKASVVLVGSYQLLSLEQNGTAEHAH